MSSLGDLCSSAWALSALRVAVESDLLEAMVSGTTETHALARTVRIAPEVLVCILEILEANGFVERKGEGAFVLTGEGAELASRADWLRIDLAATLSQTNALVTEARRSDLGKGWQHADTEIIRAQTMLSRINELPGLFKTIPDLDRLARPGAVFLDVGAGAGGVALEFCTRFPSLRAVALEPLRAARLEARIAIAAARFADRITMRSTCIEELADENVYDAAFVPSPFIADAALAEGLIRVNRALVPGGLVVLAGWKAPSDRRAAAASKLRRQLWGAGTRSAAEVIRLATAAGLTDVREGQPHGAMVPVLARRVA